MGKTDLDYDQILHFSEDTVPLYPRQETIRQQMPGATLGIRNTPVESVAAPTPAFPSIIL